MNPHHHTTRLRGAEQTTQATHTNAQTGALEFISPEAAIRHDCEQSPVPDAVAERLKKSLAQEPPPPAPRPWWQRFFRR